MSRIGGTGLGWWMRSTFPQDSRGEWLTFRQTGRPSSTSPCRRATPRTNLGQRPVYANRSMAGSDRSRRRPSDFAAIARLTGSSWRPKRCFKIFTTPSLAQREFVAATACLSPGSTSLPSPRVRRIDHNHRRGQQPALSRAIATSSRATRPHSCLRDVVTTSSISPLSPWP